MLITKLLFRTIRGTVIKDAAWLQNVMTVNINAKTPQQRCNNVTTTVKLVFSFLCHLSTWLCSHLLPSAMMLTAERAAFCSLAVLDPRVGHTTDVLSLFIAVLCHSDRLLHGESCPRLDVVHPGRAWSSSPVCSWHFTLHYLFLQATPLFPRGVTILC